MNFSAMDSSRSHLRLLRHASFNLSGPLLRWFLWTLLIVAGVALWYVALKANLANEVAYLSIGAVALAGLGRTLMAANFLSGLRWSLRESAALLEHVHSASDFLHAFAELPGRHRFGQKNSRTAFPRLVEDLQAQSQGLEGLSDPMPRLLAFEDKAEELVQKSGGYAELAQGFGVLGTVVGLAQVGHGLGSLLRESGASDDSASLEGVLGGIGVAFGTSIAGLAVMLCLTLLGSSLAGQLSELRAATRRILLRRILQLL